jgi:hypothetical protein
MASTLIAHCSSKNRWMREKEEGDVSRDASEGRKVGSISATSVLPGIESHAMALLADSALTSHFRAGQTIFREGERADR